MAGRSLKGIPLSVKGSSRLSPCSVCPPQNYSKSRLSARYRSFLVPTVQFRGCNSCKNRHRVALLTLQLYGYFILVRFMLHDLSLSTPPPPPPKKQNKKCTHTHHPARSPAVSPNNKREWRVSRKQFINALMWWSVMQTFWQNDRNQVYNSQRVVYSYQRIKTIFSKWKKWTLIFKQQVMQSSIHTKLSEQKQRIT